MGGQEMIPATPPKTNMSPQKGTISIGNTSSNHWFSGDMFVFRGVSFHRLTSSGVFFRLQPLILIAKLGVCGPEGLGRLKNAESSPSRLQVDH